MNPGPNYINVHTHRPTRLPAVQGILEIVNRHEHFEKATDNTTCSLGLHPWYLQDFDGQMAALAQHASATHVLAIGECGLDKLCQTPWPLQQAAFKAQIQLANTLNKPLIIHCVRAYSEVLQLLRQAKVPVIFHGFNKKLALAREITNEGYYLSFGAALLTGKGIQEVFAQLPGHCFFLETDHDHITIEEVYRAAASIRKTPEDVIILQLQQQYKNVFGHDE